MSATDVRPAAVAGQFYPASSRELSELVEGMLAEVEAEPRAVRGVIVPHAGLVYSGRCAAQVFGRVAFPPVVVIFAPNHTGLAAAAGGASLWSCGAFDTPLGQVRIASEFAEGLASRTPLVEHDPLAHLREHAVEVELPFVGMLAPDSAIVPLVISWADWERSKELAAAVAGLVDEWPEDVLLVASSDMTHYESGGEAARKDRIALAAIERLDGAELLAACERERITMCGRAPAAIVVEAARLLGATRAELVDYRNSGWVTGDESSVVAYAGIVIP